MAKKRVIDMTIEKSCLDVVLKLKVAPEIEDYFKNKAAGEFETSSKWLDADGNGLKFYKKDEKLSGKVPSVSIMDNFGNGLMDGDKINLALLRTVGASEGVSIKTDDLLGIEELRLYTEKLADWVRDFYESEMRDHIITSSVSLEVAND